MKAWSVVAKNLKLLFRSKETAFTIVFGPLLIILLVSAAYTGGGDAKVHVGVYAPEYTPLADQLIDALKEKGYLVSVFANETNCLGRIETGGLHTCILFPEDFRVKENGSNTVTFVVDYSRVNLVHEIISGLSAEFNVQKSELSAGLATTVLERVAVAQREVREGIALGNALDNDVAMMSEQLVAGRSSINAVDVNVSFNDLKEIRGRVTGLAGLVTEMKTESLEGLEAAREALQEVKDVVDDNETEELIRETLVLLENATSEIQEIAKRAPESVTLVNYVIDDAAAAMDAVKTRFGLLVNASRNADERIAASQARLEQAARSLTTLRGKLAHADAVLQETLGMSATGLASPIETRIQAVNAEQDNVSFTYPYILLLVIMFLGLMLNSTLIVMDKTSTAAFRNFTTATRDEYHILLSFVTTFLILLVQCLAILCISAFFLGAPLFTNFGVSLIIIIIAITLFSFLGMIIGYLSGTQEGAMIASLSLGSVLLFISNLVLPLEAMNWVVGIVSPYNPYVVLSELLKQSMLFELGFAYVPGKVGLLVLATLVLFLLILAIQKSFKASYFQRRSKDLAAEAFTPGAARNSKPLLLGGREVKDLFDLLEVLDAMTRADFEAVVTGAENPIATWVKRELREKRLGRKLSTRSKEVMILALDKHLKTVTKKLAKR